MAPRHPRIDPDARQRLRLAEAVAREHLLELRTGQALALIRLATGRVTPRRVMDIYARLQGLTDFELRCLVDRVLAALASEADGGPADLTAATAGEVGGKVEAAGAPPLALVRLLRRRLRGRVHLELRRQFELHTGRSKVETLQLHVEHVLRFARVLPEAWSVAEVVEAYADRLGVTEPMRASVYFFALERVARTELELDPLPLPEAARKSAEGRAKSLRVLPSGA